MILNLMEQYFFYFFSIILFLCTGNVIFNKNPVNAVLSLVLVFCNAAGLIILLGVEFISLLLIVVYVGAIAVLFLFVVIILNVKSYFFINSLGQNFVSNYASFFLLFIVIISLFILFISDLQLTLLFENNSNSYINWVLFLDNTITSNLGSIGQIIYTYFLHFFLICGLILLVALVAAISLTQQLKNSINIFEYRYTRIQKQYQQLGRNYINAIFIVKL